MKKLIYFIAITLLHTSCSNHNNQKDVDYIPDLVDLEGNEIKLDDEKGNVVILKRGQHGASHVLQSLKALKSQKKNLLVKKLKFLLYQMKKLIK